MKVIRDGHKYELAHHEGPGAEVIQFIEKQPKALGKTGELETAYQGTTNEEVLRCLIDRLSNMNSKFPCRENSIVITKLEESLMWLEKRTSDRKARGVEGKAIK